MELIYLRMTLEVAIYERKHVIMTPVWWNTS